MRRVSAVPVELLNLYGRFYVTGAIVCVFWTVLMVIFGIVSGSAFGAGVFWFAGLFAIGLTLSVAWVLCVAFVGVRNVVRSVRGAHP